MISIMKTRQAVRVTIVNIALFIIILLVYLYPDDNDVMNDGLRLIQPRSNDILLVGLSGNKTHCSQSNRPTKLRNLPIEENILKDFEIDKSRVTISYPPNKSCYFRDTLRGSGLPDLHSVFADPIGKYVAFIGLKLSTEKWNLRTFICEFPDGEITKSDSILEDKLSFGWLPQYIVVITCSLPYRYQTRTNFKMNLQILPTTMSVDEVDDAKDRDWLGMTKAYKNMTVCQTGTTQKYFLAMCTMVKQVDEFIPSWLLYHKYMGVDHVYIYDNADRGGGSSMNTTLRAFIDSGFVTVIPWAHTKSQSKTYLEIQIAHENDCLWRHRNHALWMIKTDVDEYIQPMDPLRPKIIDYLKDPKLYSLGGIRIQNWFFGRQQNTHVPDGNIIERNIWRSKFPTMQNTGHDKNILRPINVHYFKIHAIKLGGELKSLNPFNDMRMVHYRGDNPRKLNFRLPTFNVQDTSMMQIWKSVLKQESQSLNLTSIPIPVI